MRGLGERPIIACSIKVSAGDKQHLCTAARGQLFGRAGPTRARTRKAGVIPRRSLGEVSLDVDGPLVVAPALFPRLQNGLLQIHDLHPCGDQTHAWYRRQAELSPDVPEGRRSAIVCLLTLACWQLATDGFHRITQGYEIVLLPTKTQEKKHNLMPQKNRRCVLLQLSLIWGFSSSAFYHKYLSFR